MRWRKILNEFGFVKIVVFTSPGKNNINQDLQTLSCVFLQPSFHELTRHHLTIICNRCKNHPFISGFSICITGRTSKVLQVITIVFWRFATSSTMIFFSSTKKKLMFPYYFLIWMRSFENFSILMTFERTVSRRSGNHLKVLDN